MASHVSFLYGSGAREETAVDSIHNGRCINHPAAKVSSVQALDGIFTALDFVELEIDVTLGVRIDGNMNNVSILPLSFRSNVVFEFLDPVVALFPNCRNRQLAYSSVNRCGHAVLTLRGQTYCAGQHSD